MTLREIIERSAEPGYVALDALEQNGFVIVPREATPEMTGAVYDPGDPGAEGETGMSRDQARRVWAEMIDAALAAHGGHNGE